MGIFKSGEIQPFEKFLFTSYACDASQLVENETFFDSGEKVKNCNDNINRCSLQDVYS